MLLMNTLFMEPGMLTNTKSMICGASYGFILGVLGLGVVEEPFKFFTLLIATLVWVNVVRHSALAERRADYFSQFEINHSRNLRGPE